MLTNKAVLKNLGDSTMLNIRLCLYAVEFANCIHLVLTTFMIDYTVMPEAEMHQYSHLKWKLITFWFHLILGILYLPVALYCDWRERRGEHHRPHVRKLNQFRHVVFTSLLLPSTCFGDTLFWRLWHTNPAMICPPTAHKYLTYATQHRLHTASLATVLCDLLLVRRRRPRSLRLHVTLMMGLATSYIVMAAYNRYQGFYIYPAFGLPPFKLLLFTLVFYIDHFLYFTLQWKIIDLLWGQRVVCKKYAIKDVFNNVIKKESVTVNNNNLNIKNNVGLHILSGKDKVVMVN